MAATNLDQDVYGPSLHSRHEYCEAKVSKEGLIKAGTRTRLANGGVSAYDGAHATGDTYRDVNVSAIPTLPEAIQLSYVAEGAANIIYRFSLPSDFPEGVFPSGADKTHLLRLRKALPSGSPNLPAFAALRKIFFPLFPKEFILDTCIIRIPEGLIEKENAILKKREEVGDRPIKRTGLYLVGPPPLSGTPVDDNGEKPTLFESYGSLIEDMTPATPGVNAESGRYHREVLVEFKPKWLSPSPSAPIGARRCRTCALRISKEYKKLGTIVIGNGSGNPGHWCPFDLASGEPHRIRLAVRGILSQKGAILTGWKGKNGRKGEINGYEGMILEDKVVGYFCGPKGKKLLGLLKKYQGSWDQHGPAAIFGEKGDKNTVPLAGEDRNDSEWGNQWSEHVKKYLMAMTVRDLTLFLKVDLSTPPARDPNASDESVQARIGDLDLKSPENGKAKYWIDVENKLCEGGWYTATEKTRHTNGHRPQVTRKASVAGDKRKHGEVEGEIVDGRKIGPTGESIEVLIERERDEEGLDEDIKPEETGTVSWCRL
ncbi:inositol-pentakisphosphate 2-kinase-domain-containing protein [Terfezia claveryi]|nr:inositol-pentakisphosphate 2-kinase-domain-containing protein [Terfezia claveryi]